MKNGDYVLFSVFPHFRLQVGRVCPEGIEILSQPIRGELEKSNVSITANPDDCQEVFSLVPVAKSGAWVAVTAEGPMSLPMLQDGGIETNVGMLTEYEPEVVSKRAIEAFFVALAEDNDIKSEHMHMSDECRLVDTVTAVAADYVKLNKRDF